MSTVATRPRRARAGKLVVVNTPVESTAEVAAEPELVAAPEPEPVEVAPEPEPVAAPEPEPVEVAPSAAPTRGPVALDKRRPDKKRSSSIYAPSLLSRDIVVPFKSIGKGLRQTLERIVQFEYEGKCGPEGFVRPGSTRILTHSSGLLKASNVLFTVAFECLICNPVEGMHIRCIAKNITKAGIRAEIDEPVSPVVVFVARDHHFASASFGEVKEGDPIVVRVIGQRFELHDKYISVIGQLMERKTKYLAMKTAQ